MNTLNGTLKPIETFYRGFRFRSRLEARYAVFFDKIGVKFQYEPEGFKLPSGYYLPDFYLPELECYVEIKPSGKPKNPSYPPHIYMAGRMEEPCWRPFSVYSNDYAFDHQYAFTRDEVFAGRSIIYTGPFRTPLANHSFLHGYNQVWGPDEKGEIFQRSMAGIKACEVFFALFDDLEAYGTLVEVGMACMLDKKIVVGFSEESWAPDEPWTNELTHNLWFAAEDADQVLYGIGTDDVLKKFGDWLNNEYPIPREIALARELNDASDKSVSIYYGDPLEATQNGEWLSFGHNRVFGGERYQSAALAARQARFEHGQCGAVP